MSRFNFNRIYVIESLDGTKEKLTGKELYDDLLRWKELNFNGVLETNYYPVADKKEFLERLSHIKEDCKTYKNSPILHFEIHGNKDTTGLVLKSKEPISWEELSEHLSDINALTGNNLFLTLAVCHGAHLMKVIRMDKPAPFYGFIGSMEAIYVEDLLIRYNEFYTVFLSSLKIDSALKALIEINTSYTNKYSFFHTGDAFINGYVGYLKHQVVGAALEKRAEKMAEEVKEKFKLDSLEKKNQFKDKFKKQVEKTKEQYYQEHSSAFFMLDKFPDNRDRFSIAATLAEFMNKYQDRINK